MTPGRIALVLVLIFSTFCFALAGLVAVKLHTIEPPERYLALGLGLVMLYLGGTSLAGIIWPSKKKDPNAPIEIPPLDQVRGRTSYRDDTAWRRNGLIVIGTVFLLASLGSAGDQPILLIISGVSVGVLAGAGVMIWRQIQYGRARLELERPARRGDVMRGVITMSGFGWTVAGRDFEAGVRLAAIRTYRGGRNSRSVVIATEHATTSASRDGHTITIRFTITPPIIDTSEGRFSWNIVLVTANPTYKATFAIDVA
jgi:hypothetical protein